MKSERTKQLSKLTVIFWLISTFLWLIVLGFYIGVGLYKSNQNPSEGGIGKQMLALFYPLTITWLVAIVLTIFITQKIKTLGWMVAVILAALLFGNVAMYITFAIWALDEYVFNALYKRYKNLKTINKEIDARSE